MVACASHALRLLGVNSKPYFDHRIDAARFSITDTRGCGVFAVARYAVGGFPQKSRRVRWPLGPADRTASDAGPAPNLEKLAERSAVRGATGTWDGRPRVRGRSSDPAGRLNKIIAYELGMCGSTVKVHMRLIMNRTDVAIKSQTVSTAVRGRTAAFELCARNAWSCERKCVVLEQGFTPRKATTPASSSSERPSISTPLAKRCRSMNL